MDRREFVKMLALLAAGTAALPSQIGAFEQYYNANTPSVGPFLAIDEISFAGLSQTNSPLKVEILQGNNLLLACGLNTFGGVFLWRAQPDGKIVDNPDKVSWKMTRYWNGIATEPDDRWIQDNLHSHVRFIDSNSRRHTLPIITACGTVS